MKMIRTAAFATGLAALFGAVSPAASAPDTSTCSCLTNEIRNRVAGRVLEYSGDVVVRAGSGSSKVAGVTDVIRGGRVIAGANSSASGQIGENCRFSLSANQEIEIASFLVNGARKLCVRRIGDIAPAQPTQPVGQAPSGPILGGSTGVVLGGAAALAGGAIIIGASRRNGGRVSN